MPQKSLTLHSAAATGFGQPIPRDGGTWGYQLNVSGTGAVAATANIYGTHDGTNFVLLGSMSASGTTSASDTLPPMLGFFAQHKAEIATLTGTGAVATITGSGG